MTLLESWAASPLAGALGWALLHSLWEGAVLAAALAIVLAAMRAPRLRYAAACLALAAMLAGFLVTLALVFPETVRNQPAARTPGFPIWQLGAAADEQTPRMPGLAAALPWLTAIWILGVWAFYFRQAAGWASLRRLQRRGVCPPPERWRRDLVRLSGQLRVSRPVLLLESFLADTPMVLGHFRPVILVPAGLLVGMPAAQMEALLLHELAHIRRCDYLVNLLQRAVEGLFFYHPAAWWISRVIRAERENCCDDIAVEIGGDAHEYAVALATLEQNRWPGRETVMAATGGNLVKRIRRLLYPQGPASASAPLLAVVLFVTTAGLALAAWHAQPVEKTSASAQQQMDSASTSPFQKWLNEDVVYIITDQERTAFQKLTTDDEREMAIRQFWERRNPTPGAAVNQFREEHYRRIAYANSRYAANTAGWKTDRGRIYIQFGPPDEIESRPSGSAAKPPSEAWLYQYLDGVGKDAIFKFVDQGQTGDYKLVTGKTEATSK